jgi:hypothetical protein
MADFFKWANDSPAATLILILALCVFVLAFASSVVLFIWTFIKDRPITMFGFKLPESKMVYETGQIALPANKNPELWDEKRLYKGVRSLVVTQRFSKRFKEKPDVVIGLTKIDTGVGIVRVEAFVENNITPEGFTLHFQTWEDSRVYDAAVSWVAIGR